jgi:glycosyltransferase involved in cell wall biosynthesis
MALVTICIPTYSARRLPYLREAVASALAQTHQEIEVLLSDNGSDAPIRAFADEQSRRDARVRYRRNDPSVSLAGNFGAALRDARGDYVIFNGDDDRLLPPCVATLLAAHESDTVVAFSNHHIIDDAGARCERLTRSHTVSYGRHGLPRGRVGDAIACAWRNSIPITASLIRTSDARRLGIRPESNALDLDLFIRLAADGGAFVFVPDFLTEYRVHPGAATSAGGADMAMLDLLEPIAVPAHVEPLKRRILGDTLFAAVSGALKQGDVNSARALIRHRYYPSLRERPVPVLAQRALSLLPPGAAMSGAALAARARGRARRLRQV